VCSFDPINFICFPLYKELRLTFYPDLPSTKILHQIKAALVALYKQVNVKVAQRLKLNTRVQRSGENMKQFLSELRELAMNCRYPDRARYKDALLESFVRKVKCTKLSNFKLRTTYRSC
jgi:hypothetical protein